MAKVRSSNLGYPHIGANREWKKAIESYWKGTLAEPQFLAQMDEIRLDQLRKQRDAGVDLIPVNDFTFYDHVLDTAVMFGVIPGRYKYPGGKVPLSTYYAMARGRQEVVACEMTKWFNTNYHYIVPEYEGGKPRLVENRPLIAYKEAKEKLAIRGKPVIVGPYSFAKFSKGVIGSLSSFVAKFLPLYVQMLKELAVEGVEFVQMDEPVLVSTVCASDLKLITETYEKIAEEVPDLKIILQTYFHSIDAYEQIVKLPVAGVGLDFVHGLEGNLKNLETLGFPSDKLLGVGVINGRNIWRANLNEKLTLLKRIQKVVAKERILVQPSCSLFLSPVNKSSESKLPKFLFNAISYADEKLAEIKSLTDALNGSTASLDAFAESEAAIKAFREEQSKLALDPALKHPETLGFDRSEPFESRIQKQQAKLKLPLLPTTTIGSFPQTAEVRETRMKWRKGLVSDVEYQEYIDKQIARWIQLQDEIGLDVYVHGEFERTDMVEYFGEKLIGFAFTQNGWVQSYGSRCVKPPIIYGNVSFVKPMTVRESVYAQSLTKKPLKGMLTGPVTILNWSFVRDDLPRSEVAFQIGFALRQEVLALEAAGIGVIQVDEPAVREGLPLKRSEWQEYLKWAVNAFRLATCKVRADTQIHTHMCYCEFQDIIEDIVELDADVISIETSRSHGEMITAFETYNYRNGIGLGVYDIHSPRVPSVEEMVDIIGRGVRVVKPSLFWVNPDCGLKTRAESETISSLKNMVAAAKISRDKL